MRITDEVPTSWKDLQDKVCKYLNQAGYHAESPKTIAHVRGTVEVDVFVTVFRKGIAEFEELFRECPVEEWKLDMSNSRTLEPCIMDYLSD